MKEELMILSKTIFGEAHNRGLSGMEAVANVILNRVKHARLYGTYWWGNSIKEVCLKPYQFPCWQNNADLLSNDLSNNPIYHICKRIATRAIKGLLPDNTKGATHYHDKNEHPTWAHAAVPCADISHRLFYAHI